jgi:hypothetical protein
MHLNGPEFLPPVFDFLGDLIRDDGDILFVIFVYAALAVPCVDIVWRTAAEAVSVETRASCYHRSLHTHRTTAAMSASVAASYHRERTRSFPG